MVDEGLTVAIQVTADLDVLSPLLVCSPTIRSS